MSFIDDARALARSKQQAKHRGQVVIDTDKRGYKRRPDQIHEVKKGGKNG